MRIILILWFFPLALFWGWYGLSYYDINLGTTVLSRQLHDMVFQIYGNMLNMDPARIPGLAAWACFLDSLVVLGIAAFRWRKSWYPQTKAKIAQTFHSFWNEEETGNFLEVSYEASASGRVHPAE